MVVLDENAYDALLDYQEEMHALSVAWAEMEKLGRKYERNHQRLLAASRALLEDNKRLRKENAALRHEIATRARE
jgi:hypothetical protein